MYQRYPHLACPLPCQQNGCGGFVAGMSCQIEGRDAHGQPHYVPTTMPCKQNCQCQESPGISSSPLLSCAPYPGHVSLLTSHTIPVPPHPGACLHCNYVSTLKLTQTGHAYGKTFFAAPCITCSMRSQVNDSICKDSHTATCHTMLPA